MKMRDVEVDENIISGPDFCASDSGTGQSVAVLKMMDKTVHGKSLKVRCHNRPTTHQHGSCADYSTEKITSVKCRPRKLTYSKDNN